MRTIDCATEDWRALLRRQGARRDPELEKTVASIVEDVRRRGDEAVLEYGRRFDSPALEQLRASASELREKTLPEDQAGALRLAFERILRFHRLQLERFTGGLEKRETGWSWNLPDSQIGQRVLPLGSVGLYVPGGLASYPSSVLMLAGPTIAAGVASVALANPCMSDGTLSQAVGFAASIAAIGQVYKMGGASAIAAFAFGTETIGRVDKVIGPGNRFVNEAKRQLWGQVGVDGQYGPSEVAVVIDSGTNLRFAVADLLTQIEHAPDNLGFVILIDDAESVTFLQEIERQVGDAPRAAILRRCLENVLLFLASGANLAADIINEIAPEHLSLCVSDPSKLLELVKNAGCILVGEWTPESASDYLLGPCHTLPTGTAARFASPVNVLDFLKIQSYGRLERSEIMELAGAIQTIARVEGFPAHGYGATARLQTAPETPVH